MKKIISLLVLCGLTLFVSAQTLVCNFDDVWPKEMIGWGDVYNGFWQWGPCHVKDPANSGNMVGLVKCSGETNSGGFVCKLSTSYNSDNYSGIQLKVKSKGQDNIGFVFTLEKNSGERKGNWTSKVVYDSNGQWQTITLPFLSSQAGFDFDKFSINPHSTDPNSHKEIIFYIDNITLISKTSGNNKPE